MFLSSNPGFQRFIQNSYLQLLILWAWVGVQFENAIPTGNEENYFALARQFYDPSWLPLVPQFTEFPGTRILYQYLAGFCLSHITFEAFAFWGGLAGLLLLLIPIHRLFQSLHLSLLQKLLVIQLFIFGGQAYFGGSWLFGGIEPKTLAYVLVLLSLTQLLKGREGWALILAALATWFHVLVGGWFTLGIGVFLLISKYPIKKLVLYSSLWLLITAPLLIYLFGEIVNPDLSKAQQLRADYIYTHIRAPHHTALFMRMGAFVNDILPRALFLLISVMFAFFNKPASEYGKRLRLVFMVFGVMLLINLVISYFDSNGSFTKFYPFRMASLALLIFVTLFFTMIREKTSGFGIVTLLQGVALMCLLPGFIKNMEFNFKEQPAADRELYAYAQGISKKEDVFFFASANGFDDRDLAFSRIAERPRYFVFKFIPANAREILEWHNRYEISNLLHSNLNNISKVTAPGEIDFVITSGPVQSENFHLAKEINGRYIYRVAQAEY